jgi:hypothetical protein
MEFMLLFVLLLFIGGEKSAARSILSGIAIGIGIAFVLPMLVLSWSVFPNVSKMLAVVTIILGLAFCVGWVYKRFFSPEARLKASYKRMHDNCDRLSYFVAELLRGHYNRDLSWAQRRGQKLLRSCRAQYEIYKTLPPDRHWPQPQPYLWIDDWEQQMNEAFEKLAPAPIQP